MRLPGSARLFLRPWSSTAFLIEARTAGLLATVLLAASAGVLAQIRNIQH
jgi:hypothetical protein